MSDSPRDPAAEAEKMLDRLEAEQFNRSSPPSLVHRRSLLTLLRELVERREGDRWRRLGDEAPAPDQRVIVLGGMTISLARYDADSNEWDDDNWNRSRAGLSDDLWRPFPAPPAEEKAAECQHDRLNEDGVCRSCGADRRGI